MSSSRAKSSGSAINLTKYKKLFRTVMKTRGRSFDWNNISHFDKEAIYLAIYRRYRKMWEYGSSATIRKLLATKTCEIFKITPQRFCYILSIARRRADKRAAFRLTLSYNPLANENHTMVLGSIALTVYARLVGVIDMPISVRPTSRMLNAWRIGETYSPYSICATMRMAKNDTMVKLRLFSSVGSEEYIAHLSDPKLYTRLCHTIAHRIAPYYERHKFNKLRYRKCS